MPENQFKVADQYQMYLRRVELKESDMHPAQRSEIKRAFFGAWGQMLALMQGPLPDLPEDDGCKILDEMIEEVRQYWVDELLPKHKKN